TDGISWEPVSHGMPSVGLPLEETRPLYSGDELLQKSLALPQRPHALGAAAFVGPVLHLDADRPIVPDVAQRREEPAPLHVAESRQLRRVPAETQDADAVQLVAIDARVLGMDM